MELKISTTMRILKNANIQRYVELVRLNICPLQHNIRKLPMEEKKRKVKK